MGADNLRGGNGAVVVPAITFPSTLACIRSLGRRGVKSVVVSEDADAPAFASKFCDESVVVPSPEGSSSDYADALLSLARRPEVRTILPVREKDIYVLSKHREEFAEHVGTPWPTFESLRDVQDRVRLYDAAERAGVSVPETKLLSRIDDWSREWIVKSRYSILADDYVAGHPADTLIRPPSTRYLRPGDEADAEDIRSRMGHDPVAQEFIPSSAEYGFFALYDRGEPVATFQHEQIRAIHYEGGASAFRRSIDNPELETEGRKLLDELDWHGLAMVEFLRDPRTGEFKLMEINPRFWSSLPFTVQTGADFPHYCWLLANGQADRIDCQYDVGIAGHLLSGEVSHLLSILQDDNPLVDRPEFWPTAGAILASLVRHPRFDYFSVRDPRPFVQFATDQSSALFDQLLDLGEHLRTDRFSYS